MGNKVNASGIRLGIMTSAGTINVDWRAKWYAKPKDYAKILHSDLLARGYLEKALYSAGVSRILISRAANTDKNVPNQPVRIIAHVARPGVVIGKKGGSIERIQKELGKILNTPVYLSIKEIIKPELDAKLIAENIASQLVKRINYRRAVKRAITTSMRMGALGIKITVSGRIGGTEIARRETFHEGRMPLHEFRARIDRDTATARTTSGAIGIIVCIHVAANASIENNSRHPSLEGGRSKRTYNNDRGGDKTFSKRSHSSSFKKNDKI